MFHKKAKPHKETAEDRLDCRNLTLKMDNTKVKVKVTIEIKNLSC